MGASDQPRNFAPATIAVTAGRPPAVPGAPLAVPIVATSTYHAGGDYAYGRFGNPSWEALEATLGQLEGGLAVSFASGMAAVASVIDPLPVGAIVVCPQHSYSGTLALLDAQEASGRLHIRRVDIADTEATIAALDGAQLLWIESPTNPALEIADIAALCAAARRLNVRSAVDNTFATPLVQNPLALGADIVVHSVTKYLAGHSDVVLGAVVVSDPDVHAQFVAQRTLRGAIPGPHEAWLALRGIRTLEVRTSRSQANAGELATRLASRADLGASAVRYPGLADDPGHARAKATMRGYGSIICVDLGSAARAEALSAHVRLWVHATSLGGVESMLERRRRWPAESPSIPEGLVRLSVGIEDVEDLWQDLERALDQV